MRIKLILLLLISFLGVQLFAQMSDSQVIEYVKSEHAKGVSQKTIGLVLMQRGVSKEQLERIKAQVENEKSASGGQSSSNIQSTEVLRTSSDQIIDFTSVDRDDINEIYGRDIFNHKNLSFFPSVNIPTPANYQLGVGDEVIIEIWGVSQETIRQTISPEGSITINNLGPVYLAGLTVKEANNFLKQKLSSLYAGLSQGESSSIRLSLGQIRTIQVNVLGEVEVPGTYSLSSLSSVFHALYQAGGITKLGSLRNIHVYRNAKKIASVDIYEYLLNGKLSNDVRLFDGDVIIVPTYAELVSIDGSIKRPMKYEMKEGETLSNLITFAGGFSSGAYREVINVYRKSGSYKSLYSVSNKEQDSFKLENGDDIKVTDGLNEFSNLVYIDGRVFRPGDYQISQQVRTVEDLIMQAGGLKEDAFLQRAIIKRQKDDLNYETIPFDLYDLQIGGMASKIDLKKNDSIFITSEGIVQDLGDFTILGYVANPGKYKYADNTTIKDLILMAGGLLGSASTSKVDIARRVIDPASLTVSKEISEVFSFSLDDGLSIKGQEFILKPYDQVYIRKSPTYEVQRNANVRGEILFPGNYALVTKTQRLSDLIRLAGGLTPNAYAEGARLVRKQTADELARQKTSLEIANRGVLNDSISKGLLDTNLHYTVGIDLATAIAKPGSPQDIVLQADDELIIPEYDAFIKVNGSVLYPNSVLYKKGKGLDYYISQAGGFGKNADKKRTYYVYMNGKVAKAKGKEKGEIYPGSEIIVPEKPEKQGMTTGEKVAITSAATSMAAVVISLINSLAK